MALSTILSTGALAFLGALLYAIGDVLLLASKVNIDAFPKLKPYLKLLSDAEKMVVLSPNRMIWGALIGVFATPLLLPGYWQIYTGLNGANAMAVAITVILLASASIIGAFVHGTFYYMGEYVHALNNADENTQPIIAEMIARHRKVLIITYAPILIFISAASIAFSVLVLGGKTAYPAWMAAVTPLTMTILWMTLKRILPQFVRDWTEGAGFNIAFMIFFACSTFALWK